MSGKTIYIKFCKEVDIEHNRVHRWYAHTGHRKNIICVAKAIKDLPNNFICGIILHELGHMLSGYITEKEADLAVKNYLGITIKYREFQKDKLEWVSDKDIAKITANTGIFPGYFLAFQFLEEEK